MRPLSAARTRSAAAATRRTLVLGAGSLVLVLAMAWAIVARGAGEARAGATALRVGDPAPDFTVETMDAAPFSLSAARGRPVWISFWTSWCAPCRGEMPDIEVVRGAAGDRLAFIAVNFDEGRNTIAAYLAESGYAFPTGVDPDGKVSRRYRVVGLPTHVFVAADGTVAAVRVGGMTRSAMSEAVTALLAGGSPSDAAARESGESAEVRLGAAVYNAQCLRCHGGRDGAGAVPPAPPHTVDGHTWHHSDLYLTTMIMRGGGGGAMPGFRERLTAAEVRSVLAYLKTWWGADEREFQERMTRENDRGRS